MFNKKNYFKVLIAILTILQINNANSMAYLDQFVAFCGDKLDDLLMYVPAQAAAAPAKPKLHADNKKFELMGMSLALQSDLPRLHAKKDQEERKKPEEGKYDFLGYNRDVLNQNNNRNNNAGNNILPVRLLDPEVNQEGALNQEEPIQRLDNEELVDERADLQQNHANQGYNHANRQEDQRLEPNKNAGTASFSVSALIVGAIKNQLNNMGASNIAKSVTGLFVAAGLVYKLKEPIKNNLWKLIGYKSDEKNNKIWLKHMVNLRSKLDETQKNIHTRLLVKALDDPRVLRSDEGENFVDSLNQEQRKILDLAITNYR